MKFVWTRRREEPLLALVCAGLWILPVSNAAGQIPLYLASLLWFIQALRGTKPLCARTQIFLALFAVAIGVSLLYAVHPENGLDKLNRLLFFPLAGAVTAACLRGPDIPDRIVAICLSLVGGVCLLAVHDLFEFPYEVFVRGENFVDVGNMTSPQFYLVALLLLFGLRSYRPALLGRLFWLCPPLLLCGFLMHQKRGVWLAGMVAVGLWTLWMRRWKTLLLLAVLAGIALSLPFVQTRLQSLREVTDRNHGGRSTLWLEVAPRLLPEYPWGMGYNGSNAEDFREILPDDIHLEARLRHLHNNLLQIRLELGWHGLALWILWMAAMLWTAFRPASRQDLLLRRTVGFALLALLLNGMVEYNFGDSEILKVYLVLFGLLDVFMLSQDTKTPLRAEAAEGRNSPPRKSREVGDRA